MSLTPEQESSLTSAGDCFQHYHSSDRLRTHDEARQLVSLEVTESFANGTSMVSPNTDYVIVNSAAGNATINLPQPVKRLSITVLRTSAANSVTIQSPSGTINGVATFSLTGAFGFAKFKAINGNYYRVG